MNPLILMINIQIMVKSHVPIEVESGVIIIRVLNSGLIHTETQQQMGSLVL